MLDDPEECVQRRRICIDTADAEQIDVEAFASGNAVDLLGVLQPAREEVAERRIGGQARTGVRLQPELHLIGFGCQVEP